MKSYAVAVAASAALATCAPAAGVESRVGFAGYHVELIDLDPADGIAPSIEFVDEQAYGYASVLNLGTGTGDYQEFFNDGLADAQLHASEPGLDADGAFSVAQGQVSGNAQIPGYATMSLYLRRWFTLSPRTKMVLSGTLSVSYDDIGDPAKDSTVGSADFYLIDRVPSGPPHHADNYRAWFSSASSDPFLTEQVSLQLVNADGAYLDGAFGYSLHARATSQVPEPSSWLMLVGGLAVAACAATRRWAPG